MKKYFLSFVFLFAIVFTNAQSNGNVKAIPFQEEINAFIKNDSVQMPAANSILFVEILHLPFGKTLLIIFLVILF